MVQAVRNDCVPYATPYIVMLWAKEATEASHKVTTKQQKKKKKKRKYNQRGQIEVPSVRIIT